MKQNAIIKLHEDIPEIGMIMTCRGANTNTVYKVMVDDNPKVIRWYKENGVVKGIEIEVGLTKLDVLRNGNPDLKLV